MHARVVRQRAQQRGICSEPIHWSEETASKTPPRPARRALLAPSPIHFRAAREQVDPASIVPYEYVCRGFALSRYGSNCRRRSGWRAYPCPAATAICSPTMPIWRDGNRGSLDRGSDRANTRFWRRCHRAASFAGDASRTFTVPRSRTRCWRLGFGKTCFAPPALTMSAADAASVQIHLRARKLRPIVCACCVVGRTPYARHRGQGQARCRSWRQLKAGTNCGSCSNSRDEAPDRAGGVRLRIST